MNPYREESTDIEYGKDLFNITRYISTKGKPLNERANLLKFFSGELERDGKMVAIRFSHYTLPDLYAIQSSYKDLLHRKDKVAALKWLWWVTKTVPVDNA